MHLAIAGEDRAGEAGSQRAALEARAESLGVQDRIHFLGPMSDPMPLLQAADVGVLCSETEGLSNALVEYLAGGPARRLHAGGRQPGSCHRRTSRVSWFPVGDPAALADALGRLATNPDLRRRLGAAGRTSRWSGFRRSAMVAANEAVYAAIAGHRIMSFASSISRHVFHPLWDWKDGSSRLESCGSSSARSGFSLQTTARPTAGAAARGSDPRRAQRAALPERLRGGRRGSRDADAREPARLPC